MGTVKSPFLLVPLNQNNWITLRMNYLFSRSQTLFVVFLVICFAMFSHWLITIKTEDKEHWDEFKKTHNCVKISEESGEYIPTTVSVYSNGTLLNVPMLGSYVPKAYACDNNLIVIRH